MAALDVALARNDREWTERLPPAIVHKLYDGHVSHQDDLLRWRTGDAQPRH